MTALISWSMKCQLCIDQSQVGNILFHSKVSAWIFFNSCFNRFLTCPYLNNTTGEDAFCCVLTSKYDNTMLGPISWSYISVCVCASSLGFLSDHRECDKWMCQSLMEHCDCSARHKAITRLYRQLPKILFQSTTHNLGDEERCSTVDRRSEALFLEEDSFLIQNLNL